MTETHIEPPVRIPSEIWKELRVKLKDMNDPKGFKHEKNAEACAFAIQRLQHEFKFAKKFHIKEAETPEPDEFVLVDLFPES